MTANRSDPMYASIHRRAHWVIAFFAALILTSLLYAATDLWLITLVSRCQAGMPCTLEEGQLLDLSRMVLGFVDLGALLATSIMFLIWLHGAYKYAASFTGALLQYTPGWAVVWWFVPILSLWKPYQVIRELWETSLPPADSSGPAQVPKSSAVLGWWWAAYLAMNAVSTLDARIYEAANTASALISAGWISIASSAVTIVGALLAVYVVRTIDRNQSIGHDPTTASYEVPMRSAPAY